MPLPRLRLRTLMIAVAVAGIAIGSGIEVHRLRVLSREYRLRAIEHGNAEVAGLKDSADKKDEIDEVISKYKKYKIKYSITDKNLRPYYPGLDPSPLFTEGEGPDYVVEAYIAGLRDDLILTAKEVGHYSRLRRKYDRAARYPWLPVPPDPPPPK